MCANPSEARTASVPFPRACQLLWRHFPGLVTVPALGRVTFTGRTGFDFDTGHGAFACQQLQEGQKFIGTQPGVATRTSQAPAAYDERLNTSRAITARSSCTGRLTVGTSTLGWKPIFWDSHSISATVQTL